jgi:TPP-dependent trihydroxycyclohexane-1,2-dione (THcHDO) dehydratase
VVTILANSAGLRKLLHVTRVPSVVRWVAMAKAANTVQASNCDPAMVADAAGSWWSTTHSESYPQVSINRATSTTSAHDVCCCGTMAPILIAVTPARTRGWYS